MKPELLNVETAVHPLAIQKIVEAYLAQQDRNDVLFETRCDLLYALLVTSPARGLRATSQGRVVSGPTQQTLSHVARVMFGMHLSGVILLALNQGLSFALATTASGQNPLWSITQQFSIARGHHSPTSTDTTLLEGLRGQLKQMCTDLVSLALVDQTP